MSHFNSQIQSQILEYELEGHVLAKMMLTTGVFAFMTSLLTIYMILKKSSVQMAQYKYYLLNITLWSTCLDVYLSFFYTPQITFPAVGMCSQGILSAFQGHYAQIAFLQIFFFLTGGVAVSIFCAFLFRYLSLSDQVYKMHQRKAICLMALLHVVYSLPIVYGAVTVSLDSDIIDDLEKYEPSVYAYSLHNSCMFFRSRRSPKSSIEVLLLVVLLITIGISSCSYIIHKTFQMIRNRKTFMSKRTHQMHRNLTTSLIVQALLPVLFIAIPFLMLIILVILNELDNWITRISGLMLIEMASLHSTLNNISLLFWVKPYRRALLKWISSLMCFLKVETIIRGDGQSTATTTVVSIQKQDQLFER